MNKISLIILIVFVFLSINSFLIAQTTTETFNSVPEDTYAAGDAVGAFKFSTNRGYGVVVEAGLGSGGSRGVYADYNGGSTTTLTLKRVGDVAFDFISIYLDDVSKFGSETYQIQGYLSSSKIYDESGINVWTAQVHTFNWTNVDEVRFISNSDVAATLDDIVYTVTPTPVELTSFTASSIDDKVQLNWQTATEVNNFGFSVECRGNSAEWKEIGFVEGAGNSNATKSYSFTDNATKGKYTYRLKQIDLDGAFTYSKEVEVELNDLPTEFALQQNYPNPFNPTTTIQYQVPGNEYIVLKIYNMIGQEVATLVNEQQTAGNYEVKFDGSNLTSGIYFYKITAGKFTETKKLMLIK